MNDANTDRGAPRLVVADSGSTLRSQNLTDIVDEWGDESFPASDPPSGWQGRNEPLTNDPRTPRPPANELVVRWLQESDTGWAEELLGQAFGGRLVARLGELVDALASPGFVAEQDGEPVGLVTFERGTQVEVVSIAASVTQLGVGTRLLEAVLAEVAPKRVWLVTTNDNLDALRFYQRRGFHIDAVYPGAVDVARRFAKPAIPMTGNYGIHIRDEIVLVREPVLNP